MGTPPLRILLVEDVRVVREALVALLSSPADLHVAAQAGRGDATVPVTVVDPDVCGADGLSAALSLQQRFPGSPTLILSGVGAGAAHDGEPATVGGLLVRTAATGDLAAAVRGLADRTRSRALAAAIVTSAAGGARPGVAPERPGSVRAAREVPPDPGEARAIEAAGDEGGRGGAECPLSARDIEVLEQTAQGASVREVAEALRLSPGTVRNRLTAIGAKLGARTRVDSVRIAQKAGWISECIS